MTPAVDPSAPTLRHDELTGLATRGAMRAHLAAATARGEAAAVLFLDLDGFGRINDGLGHAAGDAVLVEAAARLREAVRPGDVVARMGGDEFAVLCAGVGDLVEAQGVAERLQAQLGEPYPVAGQLRHVSASVGLRVAGAHEADADALLRDADVALSHAKRSGRDRVELYSGALRTALLRRLELEQELHWALEAGELVMHYQPQVDLVTGRVRGVEGLMRWPHPVLGPISPGEFIPVAEDSGLIGPLGAWAIEETCRQLAAWRREARLPGLTAT